MSYVYAIYPTPLTKHTYQKSYSEFSNVTLFFLLKHQATPDVVRHLYSDYEGALLYGAVILHIDEVRGFLNRAKNGGLYTGFTIYLHGVEELNDKAGLNEFFSQIHYSNRDSTITRKAIVDADQAHTDYGHIDTRSGREAWNRYLETYRLYYELSPLLPHLEQSFQRRDVTPEKRVVYPVVHQPRNPSAPIILQRTDSDRRSVSIHSNSLVSEQNLGPKLMNDGLPSQPPKYGETIQLNYNQANVGARYNIQRDNRAGLVEHTPLLTDTQGYRDTSEQGSHDISINESRTGFATRHFGKNSMTGIQLAERIRYKPMLFSDPRQERRDVCCGLFRRKVQDRKVAGKVGFDSYGVTLSEVIRSDGKESNALSRLTVLQKGGRVRTGAPIKPFYDVSEIDSDCTISELTEYVARSWGYDPDVLYTLVFHVALQTDLVQSRMVACEITKIISRFKRAGKKEARFYVGSKCSGCVSDNYDLKMSDHYHSTFLDHLFEIDSGKYLRRLLLLHFEVHQVKVNLMKDEIALLVFDIPV